MNEDKIISRIPLCKQTYKFGGYLKEKKGLKAKKTLQIIAKMSNLEKNMDNPVQEAHRAPDRDEQKMCHLDTSGSKVRILKSAREKPSHI